MLIVKSEIGDKLRELRKTRNETLSQVSQNTRIDLPLLSKIERGERLPTTEQISALSYYYQYDEEELNVLLVAEKIIKKYGLSEYTHKAISLVNEHLEKYLKK